MSTTPDAGPRTVALLNQKGGVGKTTTTANLGHALAVAGMRVCLIDLDPQGHLTLHLGIEADAVSHTVYDLLIDPDVAVADCIVHEARPNLDVILAEVDLAAIEQELVDHPGRRTLLRDRFAAVAGNYDVVLLDCPPSLGLLTVNALAMADELIMPMQAHFLALQGVGRLLETVQLVCASVNPELTVRGVALCMYERQTTLAREIVSDLESFFDSYRESDVPWRNAHVLQPPIRRNIKLAEAPSFGNTIFDYAPWCPGAIDYRRLAAKLLETWGRGVDGLDVPDPEGDADFAAAAAGVAPGDEAPVAPAPVDPPGRATDGPADGAVTELPSDGETAEPPEPVDPAGAPPVIVETTSTVHGPDAAGSIRPPRGPVQSVRPPADESLPSPVRVDSEAALPEPVGGPAEVHPVESPTESAAARTAEPAAERTAEPAAVTESVSERPSVEILEPVASPVPAIAPVSPVPVPVAAPFHAAPVTLASSSPYGAGSVLTGPPPVAVPSPAPADVHRHHPDRDHD